MVHNIEMIDISKLHEHPNNPRKDLGDLGELCESIKKQGILQNLTVMPRGEWAPGEYTILGGHRRFAAAKLAGVTSLPCVVIKEELSFTDQIALMMCENMQRNNLTVYEQAQSVQLMIDWGDSVEEISEKTGLSRSTIYRRKQLAGLDESAFKATESRDITMHDYERLFEIEDADKRNELLKDLGTNNFEWKFQSEKREQERKIKNEKLCEMLKDNGARIITKDVDIKDMRFLGYADEKTIEEYVKKGYVLYYKIESYGVMVYREYTEEELEDKKEMKKKAEEQSKNMDKERKERAERVARLDDIAAGAYAMRKNYIEAYSRALSEEEIYAFCARAFVNFDINELDVKLLADLIGIELPDYWSDSGKIFDDFFKDEYKKYPARFTVLAAYAHTGDDGTYRCHDINYGKYIGSDKLEAIYDMMCDIGYELSDEEKAYINGDHKAYLQE